MSINHPRRFLLFCLVAGLSVASCWIISCGGAGGPISIGGPVTGTITTSIADPPTCAASFDYIWVTITKVTANVSATAAPTDNGWVTLVDLTSSPKQLDLLSLASTTCILTQLGSTTGLPAGNYQQVRFYILDNKAASGPSPNKCGTNNGFNCVVPHGGIAQELLLSSEIQTGIKIPPGQIAGGSINLAVGQAADLNIIFDSCASIVIQGNGQYRLRPTLRLGEVPAISNAISGTVVDSGTSKPIPGALVLLEQPASSAIDRVLDAGVTAADGTFIFCPLPTGNYDVVVNAATANADLTTTVYGTTITFKVPLGTTLATIPLISEGTAVTPVWSTFKGQVTTVSTGAPTAADITISAFQQAIPTGGSSVSVTIPVLSSIAQPMTITTGASSASGPACPSGVDCFNYALILPSGNPQVGTFSSGPVVYAPPTAGAATYTVNGETADCTTSLPNPATTTPFVANPAATTNVTKLLAFSGCTQPF